MSEAELDDEDAIEMQSVPLGSSSVRRWLEGSLSLQNLNIAVFALVPAHLLSIYSKVMDVENLDIVATLDDEELA